MGIGGVSEVWANCATTSTNTKTLINMTASKYFLESCHIYLIAVVIQESSNFLQVSPRKIESKWGTLIWDLRVISKCGIKYISYHAFFGRGIYVGGYCDPAKIVC